MNYFIGIDPGPANTGWCCINQDRTFYLGGVLKPAEGQSLSYLATTLVDNILSQLPSDAKVFAMIERFVPYDGRFTNQSEQVCELIGAFTCYLELKGIQVLKGRAIDWKSAICRKLYLTEGFTNPEKSFDKKYSIAIAKHISGKETFKTNHEADACGLAFYAYTLHTRGKYEK